MNTFDKAKMEFDILEKTVNDPIILPFKKEILNLVNKVLNSGQSGGSMPYVSTAVSKAVDKLCMQNPLTPLTGEDYEWMDVSDISGSPTFQNIRNYSVFKDGHNGQSYYLDAIVFKDENDLTFTGNCVKLKNGQKITSCMYIKEFPFSAKTFYINTTEVGDNVMVKDEKQLKEVFRLYDSMDLLTVRKNKIEKITENYAKIKKPQES